MIPFVYHSFMTPKVFLRVLCSDTVVCHLIKLCFIRFKGTENLSKGADKKLNRRNFLKAKLVAAFRFSIR